MRPVLRATAGLCLGVVLAACGTTVPLSQQADGGSGLGSLDGGEVPGATGGSTGDGATNGASGDLSSGTTGSTTGSTGTSTSAGGSSGGGTSTSGASSATGAVPGVTGSTRPIQVGITYVLDAAAGMQAIGVQGATLGDQKRYAQIMVDEVNRHGGLGGRKIQPVYFGYDVNPGSASYPQQDSVACARFTQDNHIEVALPNFAGDALWECMRKHDIPMIIDGPTGGIGNGSLTKFRKLIVLGGFNLHRRAVEEVKALVRQKYFSPWDATNGRAGVAKPKIGIITYDLPDWTTSAKVLADSVAAAGYPRPEVRSVAAHDSYANLSKMQGQISNAQLAFRASGVTHVIIWDDNGVSTLFFMRNADSQNYRPRYGITSGNNMKLISNGLVPESQLTGATGMGWVPSFDIDEATSPTSKWANSARRACYALMQKAEATGSGFNETSAMMYCAVVTALKDRWEAMPTKTAAGLIASIERFGSSFVDPQVSSTYLSPTRHDGLGGTYDYRYDNGCGCMQYSGGVRPLAH